MEKITLDAKYSYGIGELTQEFDVASHRGIALYAPNGTCKTSLLKAISDYSNDKDPKDLFFTDRKSSFGIKTVPLNSIQKQNIYCFGSMQDLEDMSFFDSDLLASPLIKEKFVNTLKSLEKTKSDLLLNLRDHLANRGLRSFKLENVESLVTRLGGDDDFYRCLEHIEQEATKCVIPECVLNSKMMDILSSDNKSLLEKADVRQGIVDYICIQKKLASESEIFNEDFDYNSAGSFLATTKEACFFEAGHKLILHNHKTGEDSMFSSFLEFQKRIEQEFSAIAASPVMMSQFERVEKSLGTTMKAEKLRILLKKNQAIVPYLADVDELERSYFFAAVQAQKKEVVSLIKKYEESQNDLVKLQKEIDSEKTAWHSALGVFQARFKTPCKMSIENRKDVLLKEETPRVSFYFEGRQIDRNILLPNLSTGERKAMYALNIIFEMSKARPQGENRLLVFDDIVDSFDYANKYAFIEYLRDFMHDRNTYVILLTHNFDFFRTVTSRIEQFHRSNCQLIECDDRHIVSFEKVDYMNKNLLSVWKTKLHEDHTLVASIPMVRELVAISENSKHPDYSILSDILHGRPQGEELCFKDISQIYVDYWKCNELGEDPRIITEVIMNECSRIAAEENRLKITHKITLSIGARIQIERYIRSIYAFHKECMPQEKKLGDLAQVFKKKFINEYELHAETIEQALIMVPENIHINAFMYEPLVDIGSSRFKNLYLEASKMINSD